VLILAVISTVIGAAVSGLTGFGILGWVAGLLFFCFGLPGALLASFVHGEVSYAQDRADLRQLESDCAAREIAEEHEYLEEERTDRLLDAAKKSRTTVYRDNRQIHFHGRE
jgi:hypothetical protein